MMRPRDGKTVKLRLIALLCAWATLWGSWVAPGVAQQQEQEERKSHHWIVLLDVSASFEQREADQSRELGREGYRLRNETLALLQTLLAARRVKEMDRRDDRLSVYAFGKGVERIQELSFQPVRWGNLYDADWWEDQVPTGLGARTNYFEALRKAVEDFRDDPPDTVRHLVLISDGELDVGERNRNPGYPPAREELEVYRDLLRRDNDPLNQLHRMDVQVHTLAVDPALSSYNDQRRQSQIARTLEDLQFGGTPPLEQARTLIESFAGQVDASGRMVETEGPYVMAALARSFNGESRSVRFDNVLDVLWETLFPEQVSRRILPMGTNQVIVFAPRQAPVPIKVEEDGRDVELSLEYDPERDSYRTTPPVELEDLQVSHRATTQYVTWRIQHPGLKEVDPHHRLAGVEEPISIVPVTNVSFRWQEGRPPKQVLQGEEATLALSLVWTGDTPEPTRDEWRRHLEQSFLSAVGEVRLPDGERQDIDFSLSVPADDSADVLRMETRYVPEMEGNYEVRATLTIGDEEESPQIRPEPVRFDVVGESPLSEPDRFLLHLRHWRGGEPRETIPLHVAAAEDGDLHTLWVDSDEPPTVVFEWWGETEDDCAGVRRLRLELPTFGRTFGADANELTEGQTIPEGDRLICYRSPGVQVQPELWGDRLEVIADDEFKDLTWYWTVDRPPSWLARYLWLVLLTGVLLIGIVVFLNRDRLRRRWVICRAQFPLTVTQGNDELTWQKGMPKRFVLTVQSGATGAIELSYRQPDSSESALTIEPIRRRTYEIRVAVGSNWSFQRTNADGDTTPPRPLTSGGAEVSLVDLTLGQRIHLSHGETTFVLSQRSI